jgi:two-component system, cell cycle sensor histidine kinase and response regulator CckA
MWVIGVTSPDAPRLKILMVEDSDSDAELTLRELRSGGVHFDHERIDAREGWEAALAEASQWDIVLLDYSIPQLDTLQLLGELRERAPDTPAIVVSGTISEERAVGALRAGARDFVTKQNMVRLAPAVLREVAAAVEVRERRAVETALGESEARFARLVDNAQDIVFRYRLSPEAAYDYMSPSVLATLGYTAEDFYADPGFGLRIIHEDDREAVASAYVADPEQPITARFVAADGRIVWLDRRQVAVRNEQGAIVALEAVARDVTERVLAHEQVQLKERKFRAIFEAAPDGLLLADDERIYLDANPAACRLLGVPRDAIVGRSIGSFGDGATDASTEAAWAVLLADGQLEGEFDVIRPGGDRRVTEFKATASVVPGVHLLILRDITVANAQARELAHSEERFRLAQEGARMGTWDDDLVTGGVTWSDGLREVYGVDADYPSDLEGFLRLVHPDDREQAAHEVTIEERRGVQVEFECRIVRPDGSLRWVLNRSTPVFGGDGTLLRVLGIGVDITDRKRTEDERHELETRLRQAEKLESVGRLAGGVAHDFNNLLLGIRGYGELALSRLARGDTSVAEDIEAVLKSADRAALLTKQLLAFGRAQVLNPEILDLNDVVRETNGLLTRVIGDNIELVTILEQRPVIVKADRGQLEQVIVNLAMNGRDAMRDGGVLTVRVTTAPTHEAILSIDDQGTGIDDATASRIFEPFFTTKGDLGTGLGLATVHGVVAQSGGRIALETELGRGSTFTVYLPLCGEEISAEAIPAAAQSADGAETILLIEDDVTVRSAVSMMLTTRGYDIMEAADGDEAIALSDTAQHAIHLVLSDLMMPGLSGQQSVDRIRESRPEIMALYMSGYTDDAMIQAGLLGRQTSFIQKPFSGDEIAARVRGLLDG